MGKQGIPHSRDNGTPPPWLSNFLAKWFHQIGGPCTWRWCCGYCYWPQRFTARFSSSVSEDRKAVICFLLFPCIFPHLCFILPLCLLRFVSLNLYLLKSIDLAICLPTIGFSTCACTRQAVSEVVIHSNIHICQCVFELAIHSYICPYTCLGASEVGIHFCPSMHSTMCVGALTSFICLCVCLSVCPSPWNEFDFLTGGLYHDQASVVSVRLAVYLFMYLYICHPCHLSSKVW